MSARHGIEQNQRYVDVEQNIHHIVYATDGDTDDLISELTDWVFDRIEEAASGGMQSSIAFRGEDKAHVVLQFDGYHLVGEVDCFKT